MTVRICHVIFSTNRIEYLSRTLRAQQNFDYTGCEVDRILIDDYPRGRNNLLITALARSFGFNEIHLHAENMGITRNWQYFFSLIRDRGYDYIMHQEDDVEVMYPTPVMDMVDLLRLDTRLSQVQLKRNNWYAHETEPVGPRDTDWFFRNYRYEIDNPYFWMMTSLCPAWIAQEPVLEVMGANPSESVMSNYLRTHHGLQTALLKTQQGGIMVNHIGQYNRGIKVVPGEPGWELFQNLDNKINYNSQNGSYWDWHP